MNQKILRAEDLSYDTSQATQRRPLFRLFKLYLVFISHKYCSATDLSCQLFKYSVQARRIPLWTRRTHARIKNPLPCQPAVQRIFLFWSEL